MRKRLNRGGAVAGIAAISMIAGGMLLAPSAVAAETDTAPIDDAGYQQFVQELIATDPAVTAVSQDGEGNIIVASIEGTLAGDTVAQLDAYDNIVFKDRPPVQAHTVDDVVGGAGYLVNRASVCSFGFSGWSPTGDPAIITAGHCAPAGATIERTAPSQDDAPYFPGREPAYRPAIFDSVGTMGFSQWGGPSGAEGAEGDLDSTDIAAIDVANSDLSLLPKVTDWTTWESEDLSTSGTPVTAIGTVQVGDQITRSGRSTGVTNGTAVEVQGATVLEDKSWARVCEKTTPVPLNCHWVYGFWTNADTRPGDSGGSYMRGTTAVGVLSGGGGGMSFATDLVNGLRLTPGYTVMLDLAEPTVTSAATVAPGGIVQGTGGAGLTLTVTTGGATFDVTVANDGTWSFAAPMASGPVSYDLQIKDAGYNRSESVPFVLTVDPALFAQPVIAAPVGGASVAGPGVTFTGTGEPGATITLTGDAVASTTVAADGNWSVTKDVDYGAVSVTATQAIFGFSATTDVDFTVAPVAPVLTNPVDGAVLATAPTEITGTALPGATVVVLLDGTPLQTVTVPAARAAAPAPVAWSVAVPTALAAGAHDLSVTQTINGIVSAVARVSFTVSAAPTPTPVPTPGGGGTAPGKLPDTGLDASAAIAPTLLGGGLLLAAGAFLFVSRKRGNRI